MLKSVSNIRSKLARDIQDDILNEKKKDRVPRERLSEEELKIRVYKFGDLGRIRIIADFPSDIDCLQGELFQQQLFLGVYPCPKGIKDFIFDPNFRDGLKGHRARQFSVRTGVNGELDFGFEVQLMTRLQHAWDRRNHPLYEWQRENNDWTENQKAVEIAVDDFACSETLHLVDRQADRNWIRFQDFLKPQEDEIHE